MGRRAQVIAGVAAVALLAVAWLLVRAGAGDDGSTDARGASPTTATFLPGSGGTTVPGQATTTTRDAPSSTTTTAPPPLPGGLRFQDATTAAGFDAPHRNRRLTGQDIYSGGAAVGDVDGDGDPDVLLTRIGLPNRLLRNDGHGRFTDVAATAGVVGDRRQGYAGAVFADVEGDGDLDLFLTGAGHGAAALFLNDGRGRFTDGTAGAGLAGLADDGPLGTTSFGAAFDDWDHDGDLDLVTLQWYTDPLSAQLNGSAAAGGPPPSVPEGTGIPQCTLASARRAALGRAGGGPKSLSHLYRNDGAGHFRDVTASSGIPVDTIIGFQPVFADADGDGWEDLFVTGDFCTSRLYRNDRGRRFVDITDAAGVGTDENGMGSVVADVDGDGHLDWFVSAIAAGRGGLCPDGQTFTCTGNRLYLGDGTGRFTDATDRFGVRDGSWGWGVAGTDLDDDGRTDLFLANGLVGSDGLSVDNPSYEDLKPVDRDPNRLWLGSARTPWPEVATRAGITDRTNGKAVVAFDADGDGDQDLLVVTTEGPPVYYRNDTPRDARHHWLTVRLRQPGPNPYAIGAQVRVTIRAGDPARPFDVRAGGSFQSGDPTDVHVGLGTAARVARVEVRWPGTDQPQVLTDVPADQLLALTRPA